MTDVVIFLDCKNLPDSILFAVGQLLYAHFLEKE